MSLISQNIINNYSEPNEDGEMEFLFGRFADAHPEEYLFVFNAFYTALQNGEVNCYHENCDHSSCPVWDYFTEWVIFPMIEDGLNINNRNQVQEMLQQLQQKYDPQMVQRIENQRNNGNFLQLFRRLEQVFGAQYALNILIDVELILHLQE